MRRVCASGVGIVCARASGVGIVCVRARGVGENAYVSGVGKSVRVVCCREGVSGVCERCRNSSQNKVCMQENHRN